MGKNGDMTDGRAGRSTPARCSARLLRYVGEDCGPRYMGRGTDRACQGRDPWSPDADLRGGPGHHYGAGGGSAASGPGKAECEYQVALDGTVRWPEPGFPRSRRACFRTLDSRPAATARLRFPCRIAELPVPPRRRGTRAAMRQEHGNGTRWAPTPSTCATHHVERLARRHAPDRRPGPMRMRVGPATRPVSSSERRDPSQPPGYQGSRDFTEYCFLYREAWSEALGAPGSCRSSRPRLIFDDHGRPTNGLETSHRPGAAEYQAKPWWRARDQRRLT